MQITAIAGCKATIAAMQAKLERKRLQKKARHLPGSLSAVTAHS
jgi:hypothetical protein